MNTTSSANTPPRDLRLATLSSISVLNSTMSFREIGSGSSVVFLHGNPLSSRVWQNVLTELAGRVHGFAPDLMGMGDSGKPDIAYRFADHARYLDAWFEEVVPSDVVLVGYDWGGVLAMDWARRHPGRVRGLVVFETFLRPMQWNEWSPKGAELFRALRTPSVGEKMVLEENQFLGRSLSNGIRRRLSESETAAYYAPFSDPASRRPLLQWTREIPIEGSPKDVHDVVANYDGWLASSPAVPKLLLAFDRPEELQPSPTGSPSMVQWARDHVAGLDVVSLGPAGHHAPEDRPQEIAHAIAAWLDRHRL